MILLATAANCQVFTQGTYDNCIFTARNLERENCIVPPAVPDKRNCFYTLPVAKSNCIVLRVNPKTNCLYVANPKRSNGLDIRLPEQKTQCLKVTHKPRALKNCFNLKVKSKANCLKTLPVSKKKSNRFYLKPQPSKQNCLLIAYLSDKFNCLISRKQYNYHNCLTGLYKQETKYNCLVNKVPRIDLTRVYRITGCDSASEVIINACEVETCFSHVGCRQLFPKSWIDLCCQHLTSVSLD
jgi:hypothetical protein